MQTEDTNLTREPASSLTAKSDANTMAVTAAVDVYENADEILVVADFPGVSSDSLSIRLDGTELVIEGTQKLPEGSSARPLCFTRAFRVPSTVDAAGISAKLLQGVLTVHLAKSEAAKPRRIEVKTA